MQVAVFFVQNKRREGFVLNGRTFENFAFCSSGHKEEFVVWTKRDCGDCLSKVEMRNDHLFQHVDDECESVHINAD